MLLIDVNVPVHAHREDADDHVEYLRWLDRVVNREAAFGMSELVLSGFLRVVTHPQVAREPTPLEIAYPFRNLEVSCPPRRAPSCTSMSSRRSPV